MAKNSWRGIGVLWQCIKRWGIAVGLMDFKITAWSSKRNQGCVDLPLVSGFYHALAMIFLEVISL
jgi:hypothetical protein